MYAVGRIGSYISRGVYTVSAPFHPFGGAVDIIVVEQPDGSFKSSPWYVRFGKFQGVLKTKEKVVSISVNGVEANFHMYLDHKGEAYFLKEADVGEGESVLYPSSSGDETDGQSNNQRRPMKSKSCNHDADKLNSADQVDCSGKKIVARTGSRRARLLGLVFGRRSMKEDGFREGEGDDGIERLSSLERAEIAADLLEVKWSTNLASSKSRKSNASPLSAPDVVDNKVDKDEEIQVGSCVHDDGKSRADYSEPEKGIDSQNEQKASFFLSSSESRQSAVVEASIEISCTDTKEKVETSSLGERILEENTEIVSKISWMMDRISVGNADQACPDSQIPYELEACQGKQFDEEQACDEKDVTSPGCRSSEESASDRVQSFVYCETSKSSMVVLDDSSKQTQETLYVATGGCGDVHVIETLHVNSELLSKDTDVEQAKHNELEKELAEEVSENHSDKMNPATCRLDYNETEFDESLTVLECCSQVVSVDSALCATEEMVSQNICTTRSDSPDVQDGVNIVHNLHQPLNGSDSKKFDGDNVLNKVASNSTLESSEEEQFVFGDLDEFKCNNVQFMDSSSLDCLKNYDDIEYCAESIKEVHGPVNANDESCSSSDTFVRHNGLTDPENLMEESGVLSSPISIPIGHMAGEEFERLAESLPNMWSPTSDLSADDCPCPLSHSLDLNSESLKWTLLKENGSSCMKSDVEKEQQLPQERPNIDNTQISEELKIVQSSPTVEISLCKHLLYEGMVANAASEAFDAEKLDLAKFTSLGPAVLKNDRLVVRIDGHYFPWNVAAQFVLGMVAFGIKEMSDPKGMIPADRVEKSVIGDASKTIVASGGSWWPFTFRRSRSRKAIQLAGSDTKTADAEVVSDRINGGDEAKNVCKPKRSKNMIRAITPTSEQLASLNLKEGRNTVTFTFFTPMLGKQQVDARIYLWKWNTRIVISDVDGTITKSDVLGQFMPLVGVDWSQTGVAHLFSAIKENGYQLLFLSARAISQAYHTRRFLFNLKQDGKALPDGPVVISPDGLFPSLFREVIRRAPHEFKISCLEVIRALFPSECNPFYAGFGNRDTDEFSYLKVGIPRGKIFIINPKGQVAVSRRVDTKSYSSLQALVHGMFPSTNSSEQVLIFEGDDEKVLVDALDPEMYDCSPPLSWNISGNVGNFLSKRWAMQAVHLHFAFENLFGNYNAETVFSAVPLYLSVLKF